MTQNTARSCPFSSLAGTRFLPPTSLILTLQKPSHWPPFILSLRSALRKAARVIILKYHMAIFILQSHTRASHLTCCRARSPYASPKSLCEFAQPYFLESSSLTLVHLFSTLVRTRFPSPSVQPIKIFTQA